MLGSQAEALAVTFSGTRMHTIPSDRRHWQYRCRTPLIDQPFNHLIPNVSEIQTEVVTVLPQESLCILLKREINCNLQPFFPQPLILLTTQMQILIRDRS